MEDNFDVYKWNRKRRLNEEEHTDVDLESEICDILIDTQKNSISIDSALQQIMDIINSIKNINN